MREKSYAEKVEDLQKLFKEMTEIDKAFDGFEDPKGSILYKNDPHKTGRLILEVDASYAYDFLSIYEVKENMNPTDLEAKRNTTETINFLSRQLGESVNEKIMESEEYYNLLDINMKLYNKVNEVKKNPCLGKDVDDLVYQRKIAKSKLQKTFFPFSPGVREQKFGYDSKNETTNKV